MATHDLELDFTVGHLFIQEFITPQHVTGKLISVHEEAKDNGILGIFL